MPLEREGVFLFNTTFRWAEYGITAVQSFYSYQTVEKGVKREYTKEEAKGNHIIVIPPPFYKKTSIHNPSTFLTSKHSHSHLSVRTGRKELGFGRAVARRIRSARP